MTEQARALQHSSFLTELRMVWGCNRHKVRTSRWLSSDCWNDLCWMRISTDRLGGFLEWVAYAQRFQGKRCWLVADCEWQVIGNLEENPTEIHDRSTFIYSNHTCLKNILGAVIDHVTGSFIVTAARLQDDVLDERFVVSFGSSSTFSTLQSLL